MHQHKIMSTQKGAPSIPIKVLSKALDKGDMSYLDTCQHQDLNTLYPFRTHVFLSAATHSSFLSPTPKNLLSPLHYAAVTGNPTIVSYLLKRGVDPEGCISHIAEERCQENVVSCVAKNQTPLYLAAQFRHVDCVQLLLEGHANVHQRDIYGYSPLWEAVMDIRGSEDKRRAIAITQLLLNAGLDPTLRSEPNRNRLIWFYLQDPDLTAVLLDQIQVRDSIHETTQFQDLLSQRDEDDRSCLHEARTLVQFLLLLQYGAPLTYGALRCLFRQCAGRADSETFLISKSELFLNLCSSSIDSDKGRKDLWREVMSSFNQQTLFYRQVARLLCQSNMPYLDCFEALGKQRETEILNQLEQIERIPLPENAPPSPRSSLSIKKEHYCRVS